MADQSEEFIHHTAVCFIAEYLFFGQLIGTLIDDAEFMLTALERFIVFLQ